MDGEAPYSATFAEGARQGVLMSLSSVNWKNIEENDFNSLAEALLVLDNSRDGLTAHALDGRGGDGGIDVDVLVNKTGQLVRVYQLKWFPQGFSGGFRPRRTQIKDSFDTAVSTTDMTVWYLVVPSNLTPNERRYISTLSAPRLVRKRVIGTVELDLLLAKYPEIRSLAERGALREALQILGREAAALALPGDASRELLLLQSRLDARSAYWSTDLELLNGTVIERLRAKRPDAALREPLSISITTQFGAEHSVLAQQYADGINFGVVEPILLPSQVVKSFEKLGPDWFAETAGPGELEIAPSDEPHVPFRVKISSRDQGGSLIATLSGTSEAVAVGGLGGTLVVKYSGGLTQRWTMARDATVTGKVALTFTPGGHNASSVRRAIRFIDSIALAQRIDVESGERRDTLLLEEPAQPFNVGEAVRELADDMMFIEQATETEFLYPITPPSDSDRLWVRTVRRLLEGRVVAAPGVESFTATLSGTLSASFGKFLTTPAPIVLSDPCWNLEVFEQSIEIGEVNFFNPSVQVEDAAVHLKALRSGHGEGRLFTMLPTDRSPFRVYMPSVVEDKANIVAEPWSVPGVREHSGLVQFPNP